MDSRSNPLQLSSTLPAMGRVTIVDTDDMELRTATRLAFLIAASRRAADREVIGGR